MKHTADVIVIGAGMVGAATACMLARSGFSVQVVEQREPRPFDSSDPVGLRVSALSPGSQNVLTEAGAWKRIAEQRHCPYRRMKVEDGDEKTVLEFNSAEFALERLGSIVENDLVQWCLWQQMQDLANIEVICPESVQDIRFEADDAQVDLLDGRTISAALLVGADGANSRVRQAMGIDQTFWDYGQQGIVSVVKSSLANTGLAWQRFMPGGPLAFLPLADGSSSIVWSRPNDEARELLAMDDAGFLQSLQGAVQKSGEDMPASSLFGELQSCGPRGSFPLTMALSETYTAHNAVLIGDAAHVVHPLAGQGVNLGFLDAAALVETLLKARKESRELGDARHLQAFSRWRRSESELMARGIHGIRSLFSIQPLSLLRRLGLGMVSRSWSAKESFIRRAAGLNTNAPAVARGTSLGQLMR
jgi:ubiquinone biosynthesis UbiH/UbiF/VisC/COQ6 family hydroxylase